MVRRGDEIVVLWPRYFDRKVSRANGRRVPEHLAVRDPDGKWILAGATKAGLDATVEEAHDPARPWVQVGRVIVQGKGGKEATIRKVAEAMQ